MSTVEPDIKELENPHSPPVKPIALTPVTLECMRRSILDIFFTDWFERSKWIVELDSNSAWIYTCNRQLKIITFGCRTFRDRDTLRATLIGLLCLARHTGMASTDWTRDLRHIAAKAAFVRRYGLASHLTELARSVETGALRSEYDSLTDTVRFVHWSIEPDVRSLKASEYDPLFDDSLSPRDFHVRVMKELQTYEDIENQFARNGSDPGEDLVFDEAV